MLNNVIQMSFPVISSQHCSSSFRVALYVTPRGPLSDTREGLDKQQMHRNYLKMANSVGLTRVLGAARPGHSSPSLSLQKNNLNYSFACLCF